MRIYLGIKYHPKQGNRQRIEALARAIEGVGHECVCAVRDIEDWGRISLEAQELMRLSLELIDGCDAVLIDLTEKGVGLGIEAGYARARGKRIFVAAENGADISETLRGISEGVWRYSEAAEMPWMVEAMFGKGGIGEGTISSGEKDI